MERRMLYEAIMRKAFDCDRFTYHWVGASNWDFANEKLPQLMIYVECALANLVNKTKSKELKNILSDVSLNHNPDIDFFEMTLDKIGSVLNIVY